jgi:hypothetical protein
LASAGSAFFTPFPVGEPFGERRRRYGETAFGKLESDMSPARALGSIICIAAAIARAARPALAQGCSHDGPSVKCDDGWRGLLSGDAIIWADGTRSSASPHPSVIIGNKPSVHVGQGVFVGKGSGVVPLDDPNAPNKTRCAILDGVSYCY